MKSVIVSGACGGMGKAVCEKLAQNNFQVFALDIGGKPAKGCEFVKCDVRDLNSIENAFEIIKSKTKKIDAIVHFAGIYDLNSLIEIDEKDFVKIFDINFFGIYRINKIFFPLLEKGSKILMTSSELAPLNQLPFTGLYGITKSTIEKYAFSLRMEMNLLGIKVCLLRPGAVKTSLLNASTTALDKFCNNTKNFKCNAEKFKKILNSIETKHILPETIANTVLKILKAKKPKYVTKVNTNKWLKLLSSLPKSWQVKIIAKILKPKQKNH